MLNIDLQRLLDSLSASHRNARADYHLTLGKLTEKLAAVSPEMLVEFDDGTSVGRESSYRGYYDDLAFCTGVHLSSVDEVLKSCQRAATDTYEGYKGGDYTYGPDTPLWRAEYGCCGPAIMDAVERDGKLILVTRDVG